MKKILTIILLVLLIGSGGYVYAQSETKEKTDITFSEVSVHDPSIMKVDDEYYIIGSHMAAAKSSDLINWTSISESVDNTKLFKNIKTDLSEALKWGKTNTFWAGDWIKLQDGKYYMYYCVCQGNCPQSAIGYAVADNPEGPYTNLGILLKSSGKDPLEYTDANGEIKTYNATIHPNAVDPNVFFDAEGKFWMIYGSYSGGIYILELDKNTGRPIDGQGTYGKKLLGGDHSEIEAPYVIYSPQTKYYYMFLSFGGLTADGGYNIRVSRSEKPDGPYYDPMGNDMIDCKGIRGKALAEQNEVITKFGEKLMGNFNYPYSEESESDKKGYVSPGHNSAYYDEATGKYFLIFHSRFPESGEMHEVRVNEMFMNEDGWPVVAPFRYAGVNNDDFKSKDVCGKYKFINHGHEITEEIKDFRDIQLNKNSEISGEIEGKWEVKDKNNIEINIDGVLYKGVVSKQYDINRKCYTTTFSVMSEENGTCLWGIKE